MLLFGVHQIPGDLRGCGCVVLGDVLLTNPALLVSPTQDALCAENVFTGQLGWVSDLLLAASALVHTFSETYHKNGKGHSGLLYTMSLSQFFLEERIFDWSN